MTNIETSMTLDDAITEVLGLLTGLDLHYEPELDRYNAITRQLNRALRGNALEHEWSWYSSTEEAGATYEGQREIQLRSSIRVRQTGDDSIRFEDDNEHTKMWAYFLPRDAGHKYEYRDGLWATVTRNTILLSREIMAHESGLIVKVPVMREPIMFRLPQQPENPDEPLVEVPLSAREQLVDFQYPDLIVLRAAWYYAQTDPVIQPRVQTLEAMTKDLMYQIIERDDRNTDSPYLNEFFVPVTHSIYPQGPARHRHPHSDERR